MKRGPHDDSVIYKDLEHIFLSDQGTSCLFLEKKGRRFVVVVVVGGLLSGQGPVIYREGESSACL